MTGWEPQGEWAAPPGAPPVPPAAPQPYPAAPPAYDGSYQAAYVPQPPPQAPPPVVGRAHAIAGLSMALALLLTVTVFGQVAAANVVAEQTELVGDLRLINSLDQTTIERIDDVQQRVDAASGVSSMSWLVCGILWIWWQRRYVRNAARFGPISPSLGWGTWGWFVPFANFFYPQAQLANAARRTDPHQLLGRSGVAPPILYVWWVLFAAAAIASIASSLSAGDAYEALVSSGGGFGGYHEAIDRLERAAELSTLSYWLSAGTALMAAATVLVCTDRQRKLLTALGVHS